MYICNLVIFIFTVGEIRIFGIGFEKYFPSGMNILNYITYRYYAVAEGKNPGIYSSWDSASEQVNGYSGAKHHGFR